MLIDECLSWKHNCDFNMTTEPIKVFLENQLKFLHRYLFETSHHFCSIRLDVIHGGCKRQISKTILKELFCKFTFNIMYYTKKNYFENKFLHDSDGIFFFNLDEHQNLVVLYKDTKYNIKATTNWVFDWIIKGLRAKKEKVNETLRPHLPNPLRQLVCEY